MLKEFKEFIMRGNVVDLAIGVIIGAAFGKIVSSLVEDIITPLLLQPALKAAGAENIEKWAPGGMLVGKFIAAVISFVIIAFVLFLIIKGINKAFKKRESETPVPVEASSTDKLLMEIRDSLKK